MHKPLAVAALTVATTGFLVGPLTATAYAGNGLQECQVREMVCLFDGANYQGKTGWAVTNPDTYKIDEMINRTAASVVNASPYYVVLWNGAQDAHECLEPGKRQGSLPDRLYHDVKSVEVKKDSC